MSENGGGPVAVPEAPGTCSACRREVKRADLFKQGGHGDQLLHRDHVGQPCGPVHTRFMYRVIAWLQPPDGPGRPKVFGIRRRRPMDSPAAEADVARYIASQFTAVDERGTAIIGPKPEVEVLFAQLVGAE